MRYRVMLLGFVLPALVAAQEPDPQLPRFRAGANLVRVDAYVSKDDVAVIVLTADDFLLYDRGRLVRFPDRSLTTKITKLDHEGRE